MKRTWLLTLAPGVSVAPSSSAQGDELPPTLSASVRDTGDLWGITGGIRDDAVVLNKLQLSGTITGDCWDAAGVSVHIQIFRTDGASPSARIGERKRPLLKSSDPTVRPEGPQPTADNGSATPRSE